MSHISYVCIIYITCASAMMCNGDAELTKLRSCLFSKRLHFAFLQLFWRVNQWTVYWESHLLQTAKEGTYIKIQWNILEPWLILNEITKEIQQTKSSKLDIIIHRWLQNICIGEACAEACFASFGTLMQTAFWCVDTSRESGCIFP